MNFTNASAAIARLEIRNAQCLCRNCIIFRQFGYGSPDMLDDRALPLCAPIGPDFDPAGHIRHCAHRHAAGPLPTRNGSRIAAAMQRPHQRVPCSSVPRPMHSRNAGEPFERGPRFQEPFQQGDRDTSCWNRPAGERVHPWPHRSDIGSLHPVQGPRPGITISVSMRAASKRAIPNIEGTALVL